MVLFVALWIINGALLGLSQLAANSIIDLNFRYNPRAAHKLESFDAPNADEQLIKERKKRVCINVCGFTCM